MAQNTSTAVMARRIEPHDSLDFFPTPPWATRALVEHVIKGALRQLPNDMTAWDPACGDGAMLGPLGESFRKVHASDIHDYDIGAAVFDFLWPGSEVDREADWIITNPPFRLAAEFAHKAKDWATVGSALLVRTAFIEGKARYLDLFKPRPPIIVAPFVERVPMFKGKLDAKGSSATSYAWFVWKHGHQGPTSVVWIPPCRKDLERPGDYP